MQPIRVVVRPTPTPLPRPQQRPPRRLPALFATTPQTAGAARAGHPRAVAAAAPVAFAHRWESKPVWDVASSGSAVVSTETSGAGANGDASAGNAGPGAAGTGNGRTSGDPPCGLVTFSDPHGSHYDSRTGGFWVDIRMSVRRADGATQSLILDYPWYYSSEAANPWSDQNLRDPNFPTRFQPPPAAMLVAEPPLVQYVARHSSAEGLTLLDDCPSPAP